MFKGFTLRFSDMKVGGKLAVGFGAAVLMTILVGIAAYVADTFQSSALNNLRREQSQTQAEQHLKLSILTAIRADQQFQLNWKQDGYDAAYTKYIVPNQAAVADATQALADTRAVTAAAGTSEELSNLSVIDDGLKSYGAGVLSEAQTFKDRGFKDTGLEGEFRTEAHQVETALGADPNNQLAGITSSKIDSKILVLYLEMRRNEKDYELRGDQQYVQATRDFNTRLVQAIQASNQLSPEDKTTLAQALNTYITTFNSLVQKDTDVATQIAALDKQTSDLTPVVDQLLTLQVQHEQEALDSYQAAETASRVAQIGLSILAVIVGSVLALIITRMITGQVGEINRLFRAAAMGDFNTRANILTKDELGDTASGVNALLDQLTNLLRTAEAERVTLEQALDTLITTASSADVAEQAALSAQEGSHAVEEAMSAMGRIRTSTQEAGRITKRLGEASQEINEIVAIIEDLSDRTTVLALNASIQAAAAGDAGRGFSVVAEEVQRLAERATGETRRIENLVKTIQSETNSAVVSIDEATREVVSGTQLAQKAGEQMSRLNGLIGQVAGLIQVAAGRTSDQTGFAVQSAIAEPALAGGNGHSNGNGSVSRN